jgi:hypothetical protein
MGRGYITAAVRRTMGYPMKGYVRVDLRKPMSAMQNKPIATTAESDKEYPYYDSQGNLKNEYRLSEKAAKDLIDALQESDGRDLGFDNFLWNKKTEELTSKKTENTETKGFQNPTNLEFYHRNVLSYINPEETPRYATDQVGARIPLSTLQIPPIAIFYTEVVKDARNPDGKWDLNKLKTIALNAYASNDAPLKNSPSTRVPFSSRWGYETLKLLENPKKFNESGYDEKKYKLANPHSFVHNGKIDYKDLGGFVKPKNRIVTPSKYTPLELNNMHLYSNGRRDMLAPFYDKYPFEAKKPNPYLNKTIKEQSNG